MHYVLAIHTNGVARRDFAEEAEAQAYFDQVRPNELETAIVEFLYINGRLANVWQNERHKAEWLGSIR